ncbi:Bd3614 family nucleic acid deaminase [Dyella japonica]|uniref:Uncharacterized protein n=1 Tax=Dyella japonica A8 TaxID=1217721 RepID=A0A075K2Q2_9GAMM|nr:Bd3614 family nucleic acid deaminase [Dyella japonica]AIF48230.1 hypothetical protein HY57_13710 [Dyella japonica A8]
MDLEQFLTKAAKASSWDELTGCFSNAENRTAYYQVGTVTYFASEPVISTITPLWLLVMSRTSRKVLKGKDLRSNYLSRQEDRSAAEVGIMQLTLDGSPQYVRVVAPGVNPSPGGEVKRISLAELQRSLADKYKVLAPGGNIVSDIQSIVASVKSDEGYRVAGTQTVHRLYLAAAYLLLHKKHEDGKKDGVVSLIVDRGGNIVSWGMKNSDVSCWHGETSAVMALGGKVPDGGCIFSTLKPCKMCAGLIVGGSGSVRVYFGQQDSGDDARNTVLDRGRRNFSLDAHKRESLPYGLMVNHGDKKIALAGTLHENFEGQKEGGTVSPIDYVVSNEARGLMEATEAALRSKRTKYALTDRPLNPNTKSVVDYLVRFLEFQDIRLG